MCVSVYKIFVCIYPIHICVSVYITSCRALPNAPYALPPHAPQTQGSLNIQDITSSHHPSAPTTAQSCPYPTQKNSFSPNHHHTQFASKSYAHHQTNYNAPPHQTNYNDTRLSQPRAPRPTRKIEQNHRPRRIGREGGDEWRARAGGESKRENLHKILSI